MNSLYDKFLFVRDVVYYFFAYFYHARKGREIEKGDLISIRNIPHVVVATTPLHLSYRRVDQLAGPTRTKLFEDLTDATKML